MFLFLCSGLGSLTTDLENLSQCLVLVAIEYWHGRQPRGNASPPAKYSPSLAALPAANCPKALARTASEYFKPPVVHVPLPGT